MTTYATISVDVRPDDVAHHCTQRDGASSYRVVAPVGDVTVYLNGTPTEVMRFAGALWHAALAQQARELEAAS